MRSVPMLVIKLGGSAGIDPNLTLDDLAGLWPDQTIVFIHGANAELDAFTRAQGKEPRLVRSSSGQVSRFTDQDTMDDMLAIYAGRVNKRLVEGLQARGVNAVGLSGIDGGIARGTRKDALRVVEDGKPKMLRGDFAGSLTHIDTRLLDLLLANGYLPVVTPPALSANGEAINVDGDKLALRLALAMRATALIILSNTSGLLGDVNDAGSLIRHIDVSSEQSVEGAMSSAAGRMKKKVQSGVDAVRAGIPLVVFGDARIERPVSRALAGEGTLLAAGPALAGVRP
ncbi:MAG TPA: [LysW]-aminoadipate kinase [Thermomicrobiales bacterium]|nr:[LysW]-aminoadipate kinase [Thermomicrobiales bacterium]